MGQNAVLVQDNFCPVRTLLCAILITFHMMMMMMMTMTMTKTLLFLFDDNTITIFVPVN
jgi:hypothetical protein